MHRIGLFVEMHYVNIIINNNEPPMLSNIYKLVETKVICLLWGPCEKRLYNIVLATWNITLSIHLAFPFQKCPIVFDLRLLVSLVVHVSGDHSALTPQWQRVHIQQNISHVTLSPVTSHQLTWLTEPDVSCHSGVYHPPQWVTKTPFLAKKDEMKVGDVDSSKQLLMNIFQLYSYLPNGDQGESNSFTWYF